jgi:glycosyltransferase involved in cell wall biosynthesis
MQRPAPAPDERRDSPVSAPETRAPEIAVVVPTRNRPDSLVHCLEALERQTAASLEVIVVDDASPDGAAVAAVVARAPRARLVRRETNGGVGVARNTGVDAATARFVCFTDDDCRAAPDWADRLVEPLRAGADAVAGSTVNARPENPFDTALQTIVNFLAERADQGSGRTAYGPGSNLGATAALLRALPFDERYRGAGEERDWCARVVELGHVLASAPDAVVHHHQELDFRAFWRKNVHYGRGAHTFRRIASTPRPLERADFYPALVGRGFRAGFRPGLLVAVAQVATAYGYGREAAGASLERVRSHGDRHGAGELR